MIRTTRLKNGILVITETSKRADTVTLGAWVGTGSCFENEKQNGISHILEHMAFKGTKSRSYFDISAAIEDVGGHINAYTYYDETAYHVKVLKEDVKIAIDIIGDIVQNSIFDSKELEKEKEVIIQEIKMYEDTPHHRVFDMYMEKAFPNQPFGRPIAGKANNVRGITREDILQYLDNHYTTDRFVLSASGNITHEDFVALCQKTFTRKFKSIGPKQAVPFYQGGDNRYLKKNEQVNFILGFQGFSSLDDRKIATSVLASILGGGMTSRLQQEIREKRGLVYSIYAAHFPVKDIGTFYISGGTGEKEVKELIPVLCDEISRLSDTLTEAEIKRAKTKIKAYLLMREEDISDRAERNAEQWLEYGRLIPKKELIQKIEAVDKKSLQKIARHIFSTPLTTAFLGPISQIESYEKIVERLRG